MSGVLPLRFLDAFGGLAGVVVVDVGDRDDLDVGLLEERIEKLVAPAARADQGEPDFLIGRGAADGPGSTEKGTRAGRHPHRLDEIAPRDPIGRHGWSPFWVDPG